MLQKIILAAELKVLIHFQLRLGLNIPFPQSRALHFHL